MKILDQMLNSTYQDFLLLEVNKLIKIEHALLAPSLSFSVHIIVLWGVEVNSWV